MKKLFCLSVSCAVMLVVALSSCSSDESVDNQPEFGHDLGVSPRLADSKKTTIDGIETVRDGMGNIRTIYFMDEEKAPSTATELFNQYMGVAPDGNLRLYKKTDERPSSPITSESYQQVYKGVVVYRNDYSVRFKNGKVTDANGSFLTIDGLEVTPALDELTAKEIYANYLDVPVETIGALCNLNDGEALLIAEFPVAKGSSQWAPRLVYALSCNIVSSEGYCMIDAHTGRLLLTWANYINN